MKLLPVLQIQDNAIMYDYESPEYDGKYRTEMEMGLVSKSILAGVG